MKLTNEKKELLIPQGYPLSAFVTVEPFASWFKKMFQTKTKKSGTTTPPAKKGTPVQPPVEQPSKLPDWLNDVFLEDFKSYRIEKGIYKGKFEYVVDFSARKEISVGVSQPNDTVILFGQEMKENKKTDQCRLRLILEPKYGKLVQVDISGNLRFRLSRNLIKPVIEHNGRWVDSPKTHVEVPLDNSVLRLGRGLPPRLSNKLTVPDITVQIAGTSIIARLSQLELSGTASHPKIRFTKTRLVYTDN